MIAHWIAPLRSARPSAPQRLFAHWNLDRFIDDFFSSGRAAFAPASDAFSPAVDVRETDRALRLQMELPGLDSRDFEITTDGDLLTIQGEKKIECASDGDARLQAERSRGRFERSFRVAWDLDPDSVKAEFRNGVLDLVIPKPEQERSQTRTIPVTSA